jgi:hypothetical protein
MLPLCNVKHRTNAGLGENPRMSLSHNFLLSVTGTGLLPVLSLFLGGLDVDCSRG